MSGDHHLGMPNFLPPAPDEAGSDAATWSMDAVSSPITLCHCFSALAWVRCWSSALYGTGGLLCIVPGGHCGGLRNAFSYRAHRFATFCLRVRPVPLLKPDSSERRQFHPISLWLSNALLLEGAFASSISLTLNISYTHQIQACQFDPTLSAEPLDPRRRSKDLHYPSIHAVCNTACPCSPQQIQLVLYLLSN